MYRQRGQCQILMFEGGYPPHICRERKTENKKIFFLLFLHAIPCPRVPCLPSVCPFVCPVPDRGGEGVPVYIPCLICENSARYPAPFPVRFVRRDCGPPPAVSPVQGRTGVCLLWIRSRGRRFKVLHLILCMSTPCAGFFLPVMPAGLHRSLWYCLA
jgi:hypothetical protein